MISRSLRRWPSSTIFRETPDAVEPRHEHEVPAGDADISRERRSLGADAFLDDLNQHLVAATEDLLDRRLEQARGRGRIGRREPASSPRLGRASAGPRKPISRSSSSISSISRRISCSSSRSISSSTGAAGRSASSSPANSSISKPSPCRATEVVEVEIIEIAEGFVDRAAAAREGPRRARLPDEIFEFGLGLIDRRRREPVRSWAVRVGARGGGVGGGRRAWPRQPVPAAAVAKTSRARPHPRARPCAGRLHLRADRLDLAFRPFRRGGKSSAPNADSPDRNRSRRGT